MEPNFQSPVSILWDCVFRGEVTMIIIFY